MAKIEKLARVLLSNSTEPKYRSIRKNVAAPSRRRRSIQRRPLALSGTTRLSTADSEREHLRQGRIERQVIAFPIRRRERVRPRRGLKHGRRLPHAVLDVVRELRWRR